MSANDSLVRGAKALLKVDGEAVAELINKLPDTPVLRDVEIDPIAKRFNVEREQLAFAAQFIVVAFSSDPRRDVATLAQALARDDVLTGNEVARFVDRCKRIVTKCTEKLTSLHVASIQLNTVAKLGSAITKLSTDVFVLRGAGTSALFAVSKVSLELDPPDGTVGNVSFFMSIGQLSNLIADLNALRTTMQRAMSGETSAAGV